MEKFRKICPKVATILAAVAVASACHYHVHGTHVEIVDPVRHYPPIVQGGDVRLSYKLYNRGRNPFVISDIQPDCLSITMPEEKPHVVPPGDSTRLFFVFNSEKNVGLTTHHIRIFGNIINPLDSLSNGIITLTFDVPIVRRSIDGSDYEEMFFAHQSEIERLVDGTLGEKGYYTDEPEE